jgi:hypothetical protein
VQRQIRQVAQQMALHTDEEYAQQPGRDTIRVSPELGANSREVRFRQLVAHSDQSSREQNHAGRPRERDDGHVARERASSSSAARRGVPIAAMVKKPAPAARHSASSSGGSSPETALLSRGEVPVRPARTGAAGSALPAHKGRRMPELPTLAGVGEVKVDVSKAHSVFYLPCLKKVTKQLKFIDLVAGKVNDPAVDVYWHDQVVVCACRHRCSCC